MVDGLRKYALEETEVIGNARRVRHDFAYPRAAFAVTRKAENRTGKWNRCLVDRHTGQALPAAYVVGKLLTVLFVEQGFMVKKILLSGAAALKQVDDALRPGREVRRTQDAARGPGGATEFAPQQST